MYLQRKHANKLVDGLPACGRLGWQEQQIAAGELPWWRFTLNP